MATNIMNYAPEATPPSFMSAPPTILQSTFSPSPIVMPSPAPTPSAPTGLLQGHLRPAEIQIVIIVVIAGLFNAFFLIVSLRLLWRRYHSSAQRADPPAASAVPPGVESNLRRVTPMLVRQPDDELVYGLKQVVDEDDKAKAPVP